MTQTIPATAILSPRRAGQKVGYTVLNLDRSEATGFTRRGVVETAPGRFAVRGGIQAPDAGGYIQWQFNGELIAESDIAPAPLPPLALETLRSLLANLPQQFAALVPAPVVDTSPFQAGIAQMAERSTAQADTITEMGEQVDALTVAITRLHVLDDAAKQVREMTMIRDRLNDILGETPQEIRVYHDGGAGQAAEVLEMVRTGIDQIVQSADRDSGMRDKAQRSVAALDRFLEKMGDEAG